MSAGIRVCITGLGVVSALGLDAGEFWQSLQAGRPGIAPIESVPPGSVRFPNGAEVHGFRPADYFEEKDAGFLDRFAQLQAVAAREAVRDAGIEFSNGLGERAAVITGTSAGGQISEDRGYRELYAENLPRFHPLSIPRSMSNAGASRVSFEMGIRGPVYTISTACSSSNHAIGLAFWMVRSGAVEFALAGGSEAPFCLGMLKAWEALRVVSPDTCRPFSKDRRGLILGEGAAMLALEPVERARARGARIYAEISGFGMSSDAHHITQPSPEGPARAMSSALSDAAMGPERVGYINAHGTGTQSNDSSESEAIHAVLGAHAGRVMVSSTKSMHGHTLGAAGAIEASATALALYHGVIPPTANFTGADPSCDLDVVPIEARRAGIEVALSNSFAFGGLNAVLVLRKA